MTLFAKVITTASINEITEINGGVKPARSTLKTPTVFIYGGDSHADFIPEIISKTEFEKKYRWLDRSSETNEIILKR